MYASLHYFKCNSQYDCLHNFMGIFLAICSTHFVSVILFFEIKLQKLCFHSRNKTAVDFSEMLPQNLHIHTNTSIVLIHSKVFHTKSNSLWFTILNVPSAIHDLCHNGWLLNLTNKWTWNLYLFKVDMQ